MASLGTTVAGADIFSGANVHVTFNGRIEPRSLPRFEPAPVRLFLKGALSAADGNEPPSLLRVTIALNRHGEVRTVGLPVCRKRSITSSTTRQALAACRDALVGHGRFKARIEIPDLAPFPANGRVLAFNARLHGRPVILAHIYGREPVPTTRVLTLTFQRQRSGAFGTTISLTLPNARKNWGHVTGFSLYLHRRYEYRHRVHSLISASCPAPRGFDSAVFKAAKGTYYLADGRVITRVLSGSCRVRG